MNSIKRICALSALLLAAFNCPAPVTLIHENGTNILVIGRPRPDWHMIRFYIGGTNVMELRADELEHKGRKVFAPASTNAAERAALRAALKANVNNGNVPPGKTSEVLAALIRLHEIDEADEADKKQPKR